MEAVRSFETMVSTSSITQRINPEVQHIEAVHMSQICKIFLLLLPKMFTVSGNVP